MTFLVIGSQYVSSCTFHSDTSNWGWLLKIYLVFQKKKKILLLLTWVCYNTCIDIGVLSPHIEPYIVFEGDSANLILNLKKNCQNWEDCEL